MSEFIKFYSTISISILLCCCIAGESEANQGDRERFVADIYFGAAYDNFSGPVEDYINYGDEDSKWRFSGGVIFDYELWKSDSGNWSFWAGGKSLRGVRSAEIDCSAEDGDAPELCNDISTGNTYERGKYLLRNATSFEAALNARIEWEAGFLTNDVAPGAIYIGYEKAGVAVEDDDEDVADISSLHIGYVIKEGNFRGSFLEYGVGQNDIFENDPDSRRKIKARIVYTGLGLFGVTSKQNIRFFMQTNLDADSGDGADSIQTYVGFSFPFDTIFKSSE